MTSVKGQTLANFIAKFASTLEIEVVMEPMKPHVELILNALFSIFIFS